MFTETPTYNPILKFELDSSAWLYRRPHYIKKGLLFRYFDEYEAYCYCEEDGSEKDNNISFVGDAVLSAPDLVRCRKIGDKIVEYGKGHEVKTNTKNYVGLQDSIIVVNYEGSSKNYSFKSNGIIVQPGDKVVVDDSTGFKIVTVVEQIFKTNDASVLMDKRKITLFNKANAWVVDRIDTTKHDQRIASTERAEFLKNQLEAKKAQMEEIAVYKMLADSDPEAAKLLAELQDLKRLA